MSENRNDPLRSLRNIKKENNEMKYLLLNSKMTVWMICPAPPLCIFFYFVRYVWCIWFPFFGVVLGEGGGAEGWVGLDCLFIIFLWDGVGVGGVCSGDLELTRKGVWFLSFFRSTIVKTFTYIKVSSKVPSL